MRSAISPRSLRFRLLAAWLVFLLLTLEPAALGLGMVFDRSLSRNAVSELAADLELISRSIEFDDKAVPRLVEAPTHPRFLLAYGGRYWQVAADGNPLLKSPSLWDQSLVTATHPSAGAPPVLTELKGPNDQTLLALVQHVMTKGEHARGLEVITAIDQAEIIAERRKFERDLIVGLIGFGGLLLAAAAAQVTIGLAPLHRLRDALAAVHSGRARRIDGPFPDEVTPLIAETNALLAARDKALEQAEARAGNLAHGLKTPLAVMAAQSRLIRRGGSTEFADEIDKQIEQMRWHVERELVLARDRGTRGRAGREQLDATTLIEELVTALRKLPRSADLTWTTAIAPGITLAINRADLSDIVGNLLENALKWADTRIEVSAQRTGEDLIVTVDDDGPGVEEADIERVVRRGERGDHSVPGSGLGLAIVDELAGLYGGHLVLSRSPLNGLRVVVALNADQAYDD